jgi:solute carrier family 27 (fatty acid transporter), member 1/4
MTGTFKIKKLDLQKEGFDITKVSDPIYFMQKDGSYILLTSQIYQKILDGKADL